MAWAQTCETSCVTEFWSCSRQKGTSRVTSSDAKNARTGWRIWWTKDRCSIARSADPNGALGQPLHVDMGAVPDARGYWVCNTVWMLDDFTRENGPTRLMPGSHKWGRRPEDVLEDPMASHPDEVLLTGKAGSIAVMNAHLWHGGTANRTPAPRLAMHAFYCRRDKPQQQYQKRLVRPEVQAALTREMRDLLALDDPINDELSSKVAVRSGFLK